MLACTVLFRNKFGQGFTVIIKLTSSDDSRQPEVLNSLKQFLLDQLPQSVITDEHLEYIDLHIRDPATPWHKMFRVLEAVKEKHAVVQDYSISETTLEEVFLSFAKNSSSVMVTEL